MHAASARPCEPHANPLQTSDIANEILSIVLRYRRVAPTADACASAQCSLCLAHHIDRVTAATRRDEPVVFVLPAFPGKSPNPAKVLGTRPDMAERQALKFLNALCDEIQNVYAPGARIILCSDGRVFADAVGIPERDITHYQKDLAALISEIGANWLTTFNLDEVFGCSFETMRSRLMTEYGEPLETLQAAVRAGGEARRLYCGITRFLLEDSARPNMTMSKTALQKACRRRAYLVIQRSQAWDKLLAACFPDAVRLSIHPQICGSRKLGIHLIDTADAWLTPWHGVAVDVRGRFQLMKRRQAENLGAELVYRDGRPSHYVIPAPSTEASDHAV